MAKPFTTLTTVYHHPQTGNTDVPQAVSLPIPEEPKVRRRLRKVIILSVVSLILLAPVVLILLPNLFIGDLIIVPDLRTTRRMVSNPFASSDEIILSVGDTFNFSVEASSFAPIILKSCSFDDEIIQIHGGNVTAKNSGTTTLSCVPIFKPESSYSQVVITVE